MSANLQLRVNGEPQVLPQGQTVQDLLNSLGFGEKPVVVERNERALFPRDHATTLLSEGDVLEIIQITAGG